MLMGVRKCHVKLFLGEEREEGSTKHVTLNFFLGVREEGEEEASGLDPSLPPSPLPKPSFTHPPP